MYQQREKEFQPKELIQSFDRLGEVEKMLESVLLYCFNKQIQIIRSNADNLGQIVDEVIKTSGKNHSADLATLSDSITQTKSLLTSLINDAKQLDIFNQYGATLNVYKSLFYVILQKELSPKMNELLSQAIKNIKKVCNTTLYRIEEISSSSSHFTTTSIGIKLTSLGMKCFLPLPSEVDLPSYLFIDDADLSSSTLLTSIEDTWNAGYIYFSNCARESNSSEPLEHFFIWLFSYDTLFKSPCEKCHNLLSPTMSLLPPIIRDYKTLKPYHLECYI